MVISEQDRNDLHNGLAEVLGRERAAVLMEHLPPVGWAEVATKRDLDALRADIEGLRAATKSDIDGLRAATTADLDALRAATKADIEGLRAATKSDIDGLRVEIHQALSAQTRTLFVGLSGVFAAYAGVLATLGSVLLAR